MLGRRGKSCRQDFRETVFAATTMVTVGRIATMLRDSMYYVPKIAPQTEEAKGDLALVIIFTIPALTGGSSLGWWPGPPEDAPTKAGGLFSSG